MSFFFFFGLEISTSTIETKDENRGRLIHKAKVSTDAVQDDDVDLFPCSWLPLLPQLEILLGKAENFDDLMSAGKYAELSEVQKN